MRVQIERLAHLGLGLGRVEGRVWLVPFTAPGDLVEADVVHEHRGWVEARLREVLQPGPDRVDPGCPVYGQCGGCHLQHVAAARQPALKAGVLRDQLRRIARTEGPEPSIVAGGPWAYRCRIELHGLPAPGRPRLGFFARQSHRMVCPDACPIAMEPLSAAIPALREALPGLLPTGPFTLEPVAGEDGGMVAVARGDLPDLERAATVLAGLPGFGGAAATCPRRGSTEWSVAGDLASRFPTDDGCGGRTFLSLDPRGFSQANLALNPVLAATIRDLAGVSAGMRVLELYAGAGNLTVPMALAGAAVTAVELNREALAQNGRELESRGLHADLLAARVEEVADRLARTSPAPEVVVADPPRTGMGLAAARALAALPASRVVLCACDPATMARDLVPFLDAGFTLDRLVLVEMFPQTFHLETVARLVRPSDRQAVPAGPVLR